MIRQWLKYLWENEDGLFGIGMGPTTEQKQQYGQMTNLEQFGIGMGQKDILQSQDFWSSILSGDPNAISRVLGPTFSSINKQQQQRKKTLSEFGTRSGGTAAASAALDTETLGQVRGLMAGLTGEAAGALGSTGAGLLSTGATAGAEAFGEASTIQQLQSAKWNDIFKSIAAVAGVFAGIPGIGVSAAGTPTTTGTVLGGIAGMGG